MSLPVPSQMNTMSDLPTLLAEAASAQFSFGTRGMWLAIILLAAFIVALIAGVLRWAAKRQPSAAPSPTVDISAIASAVLYAAVAFGGTIFLLMAVYGFLA